MNPSYALYALLLIGSLTLVIVLLRQGKTDERRGQTRSPFENAQATVSPLDTEKKNGAPEGQTPLHKSTEEAQSISSEPILSVKDGTQLIALAATGNLKGLGNLPAPVRESVKDAFLSSTLERPSILDDIEIGRGSTRTNTTEKALFKLIYPQKAVILENRPRFRWEPLAEASGYKVQVASIGDWVPLSSPVLNSATLEWTPPTPLPRGKIYTWVVTAITEKGELTVPASAGPERKFKVLAEPDFRRLSKLKRQTRSHLVLGISYAQSGLISDAERELQLLANQNADSSFVMKLLEQVRSWK